MSNRTELSLDEVRARPKIDLHRHLLGSARPETLWDLSRKYNLEVGRKPFDEFTSSIVYREPPGNLSRYIRPWELFREVIRDPGDVRRIAFEAAMDARFDGVKYVEFRTSLPGMPIIAGQAPQTRIPADEYLDAIREAFSGASGIACRLIASVPRHVVGAAKPTLMQKYATRFFEIVDKLRDNFVVGIDLTGIETGWPASLFKDFFVQARSMGMPITIHAGETEGPEEIWAAIDQLGASRIGHGTSAPKDADLVKELIKRKVILEVCPTTSWLIGSVKRRFSQPVVEHVPPIPFVICTDNPTVSGTTQSQELWLATQILRVGTEGFLESQFHLASQAAFAPSALRAINTVGSSEEIGSIQNYWTSPISALQRAKT
jgi:adenosine deaminase